MTQEVGKHLHAWVAPPEIPILVGLGKLSNLHFNYQPRGFWGKWFKEGMPVKCGSSGIHPRCKVCSSLNSQPRQRMETTNMMVLGITKTDQIYLSPFGFPAPNTFYTWGTCLNAQASLRCKVLFPLLLSMEANIYPVSKCQAYALT